MGKLIGGGKTSTTSSQSSNRAYDFLQNQLGPVTNQASAGANALQALLSGDSRGFDAYKRATGFDQELARRTSGLVSNQAAGGILRSGNLGGRVGALTAGLQNQYAGNYLDRLLGQANLGLQAGQVLGGVGGVSSAQGREKTRGGLGSFLGSVLSSVAAPGAFGPSDRRLKKNIFRVGTTSSGLPLYQFRYLNNAGPYLGVMADEVKELKPEALGPVVDGYQTVNYSLI